jgi:hypothetical protein
VPTAGPYNDSKEIAKVKFDPPPEEMTANHQSLMFKYPQAAPISFDQEYEGDRIEISLQYERFVNPGERPLIKVNFKNFSRRRITAVQLCITAHDNVVLDVQPQSLEAHEEKRQWTIGAVFRQVAWAAWQPWLLIQAGPSYSTAESGTRPAMIVGKRTRTYTDNDTAEWKLDEANTPGGGYGIKGYDEGNGLNFSLLEIPHRFSYACWVTLVDSAGRERKHYTNSYGFWEKYKFQY